MKKGVARILKKEKDYSYFLFNDIIMYAKEERISLSSIFSNRRFVEKDRCRLTDTIIAMKDPANRVTVVKTLNRSWIMKFKTKQDYEEWVDTFEATTASAPEKKRSRRKLSYVLETENSKLLPTPEGESDGCSCSVM